MRFQNLYSTKYAIFQQDGAPPLFSIVVRQCLNQKYPNRWVGRSGPISWHPDSLDLTPYDYFFGEYLEDIEKC